MRTSAATLLVLLSVCATPPSLAEGTSPVCEDGRVHTAYVKWISGVKDAAIRAKACAAAKALDSHKYQDVLDAADFFHALRAREVLVEALKREQYDYERRYLVARVVDLTKSGDVDVVRLVRDEFLSVIDRPFGGSEADSVRDALRNDLVQALARLTGIDFSRVDISTEDRKAEVIELVGDWLKTR